MSGARRRSACEAICPSQGMVAACLLVAAAAIAGCGDPPPERSAVVRDAARVDTVQLPDSMVLPLAESTYDPSLGALLLLPSMGLNGGVAAGVSVLSPMLSPELPVDDTVGLRERVGEGVVTLLSREGRVGDFVVSLDELVQPGDSALCSNWPTGRLALLPLDSMPSDSISMDSTSMDSMSMDSMSMDSVQPTVPTVPTARDAWTVGFPAGRVNSVPLESIATLPRRDSATLAAAFARIASALPGDSASAFRGLPFTVTRAYRTMSLQDRYAVGVLVRRVPQEDSPLEEQIVILLAMHSPDPRRWTLEWTERFEGREEDVIATEALAMVRTGRDDHLALLLGRDDGIGRAVSLLERQNGRWVVRWESAMGGC